MLNDELVGGRVDGTTELLAYIGIGAHIGQSGGLGLLFRKHGGAHVGLRLFHGDVVVFCILDASFERPGVLGVGGEREKG